MTLNDITSSVYKLLQVESADQAALNSFLLMAYNESRKEAERTHDFELGKTVGYLTIPVGGTSWQTIKSSFVSDVPAGGDLKVKNILRGKVWDVSERMWGRAIIRNEDSVEQQDQDADYRANGMAFMTRTVLQRFGRNIEVRNETESSKHVKFWIDQWLSDYTSATDVTANPDFIVEHCHDWLMWKAVLWLNKFKQTFVFRQEGNLSEGTIEKAVAIAWDSVIAWDSFMHSTSDSGILE